ncbi:MAG: UDP-N-acetylmuramoyl-tripeptide--D-alanyl-D-alanine ligase [Candidatus Anoxychlamydiales bacterium]|nr:UDP-N-acetylmuramoyl-tripeptide--D-alanyl-D-alanine ligase [Candidatus Anoxychlamydiales bacterium]
MDKKIKKVLDLQKTDYQIDSRLVKKGTIFFALKGERTDGHLYLKEVAKKGAKLAIVNKNVKIDLQSPYLEILKVEDVLEFLQALAREELKKSPAKIIGITGSSGKTTTKEFIYTLLKSEYRVSKTLKSYNSKAGLPIAILNMDKNVDFLVLEMAMDEIGEIEKLVKKIASPDIALITQIATFAGDVGSQEVLARAKKEIFINERTKIKLINKRLKKLKSFQDENYLTYSIEDKTATFYLDVENLDFYENGKKYAIEKLPFKESHLLENTLAAISICRLAGEKFKNILKKLQILKAYDIRFEKVLIEDVLFIKDYYNGNPDATFAALKNLPKTKGKKIAVLGSHRSYGKLSSRVHEKIINEAKKYVDEILCIGEEFKNIKNIKNYSSLEDIAKNLKKIMKKDDVVLIKGSRFLKMEKIFEFLN